MIPSSGQRSSRTSSGALVSLSETLNLAQQRWNMPPSPSGAGVRHLRISRSQTGSNQNAPHIRRTGAPLHCAGDDLTEPVRLAWQSGVEIRRAAPDNLSTPQNG